jgi:hypothetical protein
VWVQFLTPPRARPQLLDELSTTVSHGLSRLTVAASSVASATVATVKPGLQEVSQRYQRGELAESAASLVATGADLGLKGISNLKGLLKTAVSQIDAYASGSALAPTGPAGHPSEQQQQAWQQQQQRQYQQQPAGGMGGRGGDQQGGQGHQSAAGGWNGWDEVHEGQQQHSSGGAKQQAPRAATKDTWAGWDSAVADGGGAIPDDVWDADWGK